jgi:hypothetical protein
VHGVVGVMDGADGLGVEVAGKGLRPPTPNSVESMGMPMRPTADGVDGDGDAGVVVPAMPAQVPDGVPAMPPPSKSAPVPDAVGADIALFGKLPDKFPAGELMPLHVARLLLVAGARGDVPEVVGLTPTDPSSVVPSGIPVGGTAGAGPIPSGEVMPSGDGLVMPTCADAELHPGTTTERTADTTAAVAVISERVIRISSCWR